MRNVCKIAVASLTLILTLPAMAQTAPNPVPPPPSSVTVNGTKVEFASITKTPTSATLVFSVTPSTYTVSNNTVTINNFQAVVPIPFNEQNPVVTVNFSVNNMLSCTTTLSMQNGSLIEQTTGGVFGIPLCAKAVNPYWENAKTTIAGALQKNAALLQAELKADINSATQ